MQTDSINITHTYRYADVQIQVCTSLAEPTLLPLGRKGRLCQTRYAHLISSIPLRNIYTQDYHLKIPHSQSIYQLRSVIVFDKLSGGTNHYRAFFRSLKDPTQWFHANDSIVSPLHSIVGPVSMYLSQVTPVSIATVLQQHPCLLFYELVEGVY